MARRALLALAIGLSLASFAHALITTTIQLSAFLAESDNIFTAKVDSLDPEKKTLVLTVQDDLKGKFPFRKLPTVIRPDKEAIKLNHEPQLLKRLAPELPVVVFVSRDKKLMKTYVFTNGTWIYLNGQETGKDQGVWVLTHGEPYLRRMYNGTTADFTTLLKDVLAKKAKAPKADEKADPGFGPELPAKASGWSPGFSRSSRPAKSGTPTFGDDATLFAVIPTVGLLGPLAILAVLFPAVFGGVLVLFRQWTAFLTMFTINSTLYLLSWWKGDVWFGNSWWGSDLALWSAFTIVTVLCTIWAWRRQLHNLEQGADALETPSRTEFVFLAVMTLTLVGLVAGLWFVAPHFGQPRPPATDIAWNMTLVLAVGALVALLYKAYRAFVETMLPMATEGVMLGVSGLASLIVLVFLARVNSGTGPKVAAAEGNDGWRLVGEKWRFESQRPGLFASTPTIDDDHVFAASSHPTFGYGYLYRFALATGDTRIDPKDDKEWKFGGGSYKRPISSPTVAAGKIYIGEGWHGDAACKVYCVSAADGEKVWEFQTANQTESTPAVEGAFVFTGCGNDGYRCLKSGPGDKVDEVWRYPPKDYDGRLLRFASGTTVAAGRVFTGTGVDRDQKSDKGETAVICFDAATGKVNWKTPMPLPVWSRPVLHRSELFVAVGNGDVFSDDTTKPAGAVYRLDPATGSVIWKRDLPNGVLQEPAIDKHRLYVSCRDGCVYGLDRKTGDVKWQVNLGAPVIGTPGLGGDRTTATAVYAVSNKGFLVCLNPETGLLNWSTRLLENQDLVFITAPAVATRTVEAGEQHLIVLGAGNHDTETGKPATLICLEDLKSKPASRAP